VDAVIYSLVFCAISFLAFLALKHFDRRLTFSFGVLFAAYVGLGDLVTGLPPEVAELRFVFSRWNWSGKVYSLLFSLAVVAALRVKPDALGAALPRKNIKLGIIALALLTSTSVVLGFVFEPSPPSADTIAFQLLMPSLAEELMFRGIAPALLLGLIRGAEPPQGIPWVVILIAAVPYGVVHGLDYSGGAFSFGAFSFDWPYALYTYSGGVIYGWLRFGTGSLLFPLLAHGFGNVAFALTGFV
jgi:membrane protease YdiL (CAAX protease family)